MYPANLLVISVLSIYCLLICKKETAYQDAKDSLSQLKIRPFTVYKKFKCTWLGNRTDEIVINKE